MTSSLPQYAHAVIIGNGPAALILSYILHGHIPYYKCRHHDPILHLKLLQRPNLLDYTPDLHAHFSSSLEYSTQALPINVLLDTLLRPKADTDPDPRSCIEWKYEPERAIAHLVIGSTPEPGGQWAENPISASSDIGALSYAEQLSLPGYTFSEHWKRKYGMTMPDFTRPSRTEIADYFKAYPEAVNIADTMYNSINVDRITRTRYGFLIGSHGIRCRYLALGSGIFSINTPPPPVLAPLSNLHSEAAPLLVVGSGFTAADIIISAPPTRRIIHIFHWSPEKRPSPLKGCHHTAYPEYAGIYRLMKQAANAAGAGRSTKSLAPKKSSPFLSRRDWAAVYEGFPNAEVETAAIQGSTASVRIRLETGTAIERTVSGLAYAVGRRGSLEYLSESLRAEVLSPVGVFDAEPSGALISGRTLRPKAELSLEVAPSVFIIGSLAGDSLVRHAFGSCVYAASGILQLCTLQRLGSPLRTPMQDPSDRFASSNIDSASSTCTPCSSTCGSPSIKAQGSGHEDLHVDRRAAREAEKSEAVNRVWESTGWSGIRSLGGL